MQMFRVAVCLSALFAVQGQSYDCATMLSIPGCSQLGTKEKFVDKNTLEYCLDYLCDRTQGTAVFGTTEYQIDKDATTSTCSVVPKSAPIVTSVCALANAPEPTKAPGSDDGITGGGVFLIIFFVGGFVYFAGGFAYNYQVKKLTGSEAIPHAVFWKDLPTLISDGAKFLVAKVTGKSTGGYQQV